MKIEGFTVFGDSELVVQQVGNLYQTKQSRLKAYRNGILDLIDNFFLAFNINFIPRSENQQADSLAISASNLRPPLPLKFKFDVSLRCRPSIPYNVKYCQVFQDDCELKRFLVIMCTFTNPHF